MIYSESSTMKCCVGMNFLNMVRHQMHDEQLWNIKYGVPYLWDVEYSYDRHIVVRLGSIYVV